MTVLPRFTSPLLAYLFCPVGAAMGNQRSASDENFFFDPPVERFQVDDHNWQPGTFTIGKSLTLKDTWGFADVDKYLPMNHHGYDYIDEACQSEMAYEKGIPLHQYSKEGTLNYYPNPHEYTNWKGEDLIPENAENYFQGSNFLDLEKNSKKDLILHGKEVMFWRCEIPRKDVDEGGWVVDRIGPFISTGGYDWWQFGWTDVGNFKKILELHPEGVDVDIQAILPVTADGRRIGFPPLHVHHVHVVPRPGVRPRNRMRPICRNHKAQNCNNASTVFEQHGDQQCKYEDDGIECLTVPMLRRITHDLDIEGELNDVRPAGSESIEWYFETAFRWRPRKLEDTPMSMMTLMAPAKFTFADQLHRAYTFDTPTHAEHIMWYTGHMWASGELIRNKLHTHNTVFDSAQWFLAAPKDLGLDQQRFWPTRSWLPLGTVDVGFATNADLLQFLLDNLEEAQRKFDQYCIGHEQPNHEVCQRPRPRLVCAGKYQSEKYEFNGTYYDFDRRPTINCEPWTFRKGDQFTVTGFSRHVTEPIAPHKPGYIPAFIPGHVTWHFWYKHEGRESSSFARVFCNQEGIFYSTQTMQLMHQVAGMGVAGLLETGIPRTHTTKHILTYLFLFIGLSIVGWTGMTIKKKLKSD